MRVIGPVIDAEFPQEALPPIYTALKIEQSVEQYDLNITLEIEQPILPDEITGRSVREKFGVDVPGLLKNHTIDGWLKMIQGGFTDDGLGTTLEIEQG